jgi:hypothetical protein
MINSFRTNIGTRSRCRAVRKHIAKALVGQTVDLLVDAHTIVHGVVTGVMNEAGASKLVVDGTGYDLNQILTAMPASLALCDNEATRTPPNPCLYHTGRDQQLQTQH